MNIYTSNGGEICDGMLRILEVMRAKERLAYANTKNVQID